MAKTNKSGTKVQNLVALRERALADGTISLYLDISHGGKRTREFLKMYLLAGTTKIIKETNKQTLAQAEAVRAQRQIQLQNGEYEAMSEFKPNTYFLPYYRKMCADRLKTESRGNWGNWNSALRYLELYCSESTTFNEITPEWIEGFKEFLNYVEKDTHQVAGKTRKKKDFLGLSQNSKHSYFCKLKACINHAYEERIIMVNPLKAVKGIKPGEPKHVYLSWEEVVKLKNTDCCNPVLKRAFLFSCLTGLRKSDIIALTWDCIQEMDGMTRIVFKQRKTGGQEYLDIPDQAMEYLGERGKPKDHVFDGFCYGVFLLNQLRKWCVKAGITKDVTFHTSRHTFAVLLLEFGADIYTVSKMLGHRNLATTQIYADVLDTKKQAAVKRFPTLPSITLPDNQGINHFAKK